MTHENTFLQKQLTILVLAAFLTDSFIQPFGRQTAVLPARVSILAGALQCAVLWCVCLAYAWACRRTAPGKLENSLLCAALVLSIALEIIQGERFYNYVMQQQLPAAVFLALVFAAAYYGAFAGVQALSRAAWVVLGLTAASVALLSCSVASQMQFSHLQTPAAGLPQLADAAAQQFYLPPELLLLPFLCGRPGSQKGSTRLIWAVFLTNCLLCLLGELTMGAAYAHTTQPVFTIARLGGLSVFRRLDALHVGVWLLLFLVKITLYFAGFIRLWPKGFIPSGRHAPYWVAFWAVIVVFLAVWNQNEGPAFWVQQGLLAAVALCMLGRRALGAVRRAR